MPATLRCRPDQMAISLWEDSAGATVSLARRLASPEGIIPVAGIQKMTLTRKNTDGTVSHASEEYWNPVFFQIFINRILVSSPAVVIVDNQHTLGDQ